VLGSKTRFLEEPNWVAAACSRDGRRVFWQESYGTTWTRISSSAIRPLWYQGFILRGVLFCWCPLDICNYGGKWEQMKNLLPMPGLSKVSWYLRSHSTERDKGSQREKWLKDEKWKVYGFTIVGIWYFAPICKTW
jgi:hypothetical protein